MSTSTQPPQTLPRLSEQQIHTAFFFIFPLLWFSGTVTRHIDCKMVFLWAWGLWSAHCLLVSSIHRFQHPLKQRSWWSIYFLSLFFLVVQLFVSTFASIDISNSLLGGELYRVGAISTLAFFLISLRLRLSLRQFLPLVYFQSLALVILALLLDVTTWPIGFRLRGSTYQPNILAAHLSIGCLIGIYLYKTPQKPGENHPILEWLLTKWTSRRPLVWCSQGLLLLGLWLTKSRGAFVLLIVCSAFSFFLLRRNDGTPTEAQKTTRLKPLISLFAIGCALVFLSQFTSSTRMLPSARWSHAFKYRLALQHHGHDMASQMPWHGWGPDGIFYVFNGLHPLPPILQKSFQKGVQFDSTHNWYLDKFLELGWFGGLLYLFLPILALFVGLRKHHPLPMRFCSLLLLYLCIRYLWSVSMMEIELLYWSLLACIFRHMAPKAGKVH